MTRKLAFLLIVILVPILGASQGIVKREKKETPKKEKTTTKKNTTKSKNKEVPKKEPESSKPKLVSTKESDVKSSTPKGSAEEQKITSNMGSKFNSNNGSRDGQDAGNAGAGGTGNVNAQGKLSGRQMLSCPRQNVGDISFTKGTVTVNVTVTAAGTVSSASVTSASPTSIPNTVKNKCISMAKGSKWTPKEGAPNAQGTIIFTITRKQ